MNTIWYGILLPELFNMFTLPVKVWKVENIAFHGDVQWSWAGNSGSPLLGLIDKSGFVDGGTLGKGDDVCTPYTDTGAIVHTYSNRAIVYNYNPIDDE